MRSILEAATDSNVQRIVITSSFAAVMDINRKAPPYFTYTAEDWNPLTYEESIDPSTSAVVAYRGSKKFAELEAWNYIKEKKASFDIVTLCPPMTFGPVVHPVDGVEKLNESNKMLWNVASGAPLPVARVPFWVDVRDLAKAHVEALMLGISDLLLLPQSTSLMRWLLTSSRRAFLGGKKGSQQRCRPLMTRMDLTE